VKFNAFSKRKKKKKKRKEKKEKLLPLFYSSFLRRWLAEAGVSYHISHTNTGITVFAQEGFQGR
jgi:hypothetical protein